MWGAVKAAYPINQHANRLRSANSTPQKLIIPPHTHLMSLNTSVMGEKGSDEVMSTMAARLSVEDVGILRSAPGGSEALSADSTSGTATTASATGATEVGEGDCEDVCVHVTDQRGTSRAHVEG